MHRLSGGGQYPWQFNPLFDFAWISDKRYLDSTGSVGIVSPNKGVEPLIQSSSSLKGVYGADYGSQGKGRIRLDAVDDWMSADAIAPLISGNPGQPPHDFTIVQSFDLRVVTGKPSLWSFGDTSNSHSIFTVIPQSPGTGGVNEYWQVNWFDDAAHPTTESDSNQVVTGRHVMVASYSRAANRTTVWLDGVLLATTNASPLGTGQATFSKFTIGAFRGASVLQPAAIDWRCTLLSRQTLALPQFAKEQSYLRRETA